MLLREGSLLNSSSGAGGVLGQESVLLLARALLPNLVEAFIYVLRVHQFDFSRQGPFWLNLKSTSSALTQNPKLSPKRALGRHSADRN